MRVRVFRTEICALRLRVGGGRTHGRVYRIGLVGCGGDSDREAEIRHPIVEKRDLVSHIKIDQCNGNGPWF